MEEKDLLKGRVRDLSFRVREMQYVTHTPFLSQSEQALFFSILKEEGGSLLKKECLGVKFFLYGGYEEADRKRIYFLPDYETEEEQKEKEDEGESFLLLEAKPRNIRFADTLTHRDFLGALMNLGFKRECFGDILTDSHTGYIFVEKGIADQVKEELSKVKHTDMDCSLLLPKELPLRPRFEEKNVFIASDRLDNVLAEVFSLSRRSAQEVIASESVFVNGVTEKNNSHVLKANDRVSVKGHGKFLYLDEARPTKRGRLVAKVKLYI